MSLYVRETALDEGKLAEALSASLRDPIGVMHGVLSPRWHGDIDFKKVRELLEAGASPNSNITVHRDNDTGSTTPWRRYIQELEVNSARASLAAQGGGRAVSRTQAYLVCRLLLSKGAIAEDGDWKLFGEIFLPEQNDALRLLVPLPEVVPPLGIKPASSMRRLPFFSKFKLGILSW